MATYRQGLVYLLLGNYRSAATLFERSILQVRMDRSNRAMMAAKSMARGEEMAATDQFLAIPSSLQQQASWEFDTGICLLEGGELFQNGDQLGAAEHLTRALTLEPDLPMRPVAAYYLEKLGKPVPPKRDATAEDKPVRVRQPSRGRPRRCRPRSGRAEERRRPFRPPRPLPPRRAARQPLPSRRRRRLRRASRSSPPSLPRRAAVTPRRRTLGSPDR